MLQTTNVVWMDAKPILLILCLNLVMMAGKSVAFSDEFGSSSGMDNLVEWSFRNRVSAALQELKTVLDNTRNPVLAEDVPHEYSDKFLLAGEHILVVLLYFVLALLESFSPKKHRSGSRKFLASVMLA
jgi:hypothetical protein